MKSDVKFTRDEVLDAMRLEGLAASDHKLLICGAQTGHFVQPLAFCKDDESASLLKRIVDSEKQLKTERDELLEALENVVRLNEQIEQDTTSLRATEDMTLSEKEKGDRRMFYKTAVALAKEELEKALEVAQAAISQARGAK